MVAAQRRNRIILNLNKNFNLNLLFKKFKFFDLLNRFKYSNTNGIKNLKYIPSNNLIEITELQVKRFFI